MSTARYLQRTWGRFREMFPTCGFHFERPIVLFQSDDWGRAGVRDGEGLEQLRSAGISMGERPYDFYTLETAADVIALSQLLKSHRDSVGRPPCFEMNFIVANLDCTKAAATGQLSFLPLSRGLPERWSRAGLVDAYRSGIQDGVFTAALHGISHFSCTAVERSLLADSRGQLLKTLWAAGTPYIHWRMPWIGYEYWDPEKPEDDRFITSKAQTELIGLTVGMFAKLFSSLPRSACAPGYRADDATHRAWSMHGIRIAQNGPNGFTPPHFGRYELLNLTRTVEFEPATDSGFSLEKCLQQAEFCFGLGIPAIVSIHSINFHSTVRDFRSRTIDLLDQFFTALESRHPDLLYLRDEDVLDVIRSGRYEGGNGPVQLKVLQKRFVRSSLSRAAS